VAIRSLTPAQLEAAPPARVLLTAWPFGREALGGSPVEAALAGLSGAAGGAAWEGGDGAWTWLAAWEPLDFDSAVFGRPLGRLTWLAHAASWPGEDAQAQGRALVTAVLSQAWAAGREGLYLRLPARDLLAAQAAEGAGFRLMDVSVDWELDLAALPPVPAPPAGLSLRPWREADRPALLDLAGQSFCDLGAYGDRFALDPRLRPGCPELYRQWLANSLGGPQASQALVLAAGAEVAGFITLKLAAGADDPAWVVLNAVTPARRGAGLYNLLLAHGLAWLAGAGATRARVRTKVSQRAVIRAWSRLGARQTAAWLTFHAWRDDRAAENQVREEKK